MAPDSWRSSWRRRLCAAPIVAALACAIVSAHRTDEYLQAARIAVHPDRVTLSLAMTPGAAIAPRILAVLDPDGNARLAADETDAYAAAVLRDLRLEIDGELLALELVEQDWPTVDAIRGGVGVVRLEIAVRLPLLQAGSHTLRYRNDHAPDVGAYLANALVPSSDRVAIGAQRRDVDQRELTIEYDLIGDTATTARGRRVWQGN